MFTNLLSDWDNMSNRQFSQKYLFPFLIGFFSLLLIGQFYIQFMSVKQLNKVSGKILDLQTMVTGHLDNRGIVGRSHRPIYSLAIGLDNLNTYYVEGDTVRQHMQEILHRGDTVTIYYPTTTLKILSVGFFHPVNQVERNGSILYSFQDQKKDSYVIMGFFIAIITLVLLVWNYQRRNNL